MAQFVSRTALHDQLDRIEYWLSLLATKEPRHDAELPAPPEHRE